MKLHLCFDLTAPKRLLRDTLRRAAGHDASNLSEALRDLADAIDDAPKAPEGATVAQFSMDEEPGKGLRFTADQTPKLVEAGVAEAMRMMPEGSRVARIAVVMHWVAPESEVDRG